MADNVTMRARDTISGSTGCAYVTIDGERRKLLELINIEANVKKTKVKVPIMGRTGKGNKATGWEGTGKAKIHYVTSVFRKLLLKYMQTGEDTYFDIQIENEDKTSGTGRQTIVLIDCNIDEGMLAKLDADAEYLDEEVSFTFEDAKMPEEFERLLGME